MTLQDITTTQETSRKLAEAGFKNSYFCWFTKWNEKDGEWILGDKYDKEWRLQICGNVYWLPAFTFSELWKILPDRIDINGFAYIKIIKTGTKEFYISYSKYACHIKGYANKQPQEAAAELALWAVKEGYLNPKEGE